MYFHLVSGQLYIHNAVSSAVWSPAFADTNIAASHLHPVVLGCCDIPPFSGGIAEILNLNIWLQMTKICRCPGALGRKRRPWILDSGTSNTVSKLACTGIALCHTTAGQSDKLSCVSSSSLTHKAPVYLSLEVFWWHSKKLLYSVEQWT